MIETKAVVHVADSGLAGGGQGISPRWLRPPSSRSMMTGGLHDPDVEFSSRRRE